MDINILKKIGFSEKHSKIYLTLLKTGPSSVRKLAQISEINRGTAYDILKWLLDQGLVNYYHKDKKQYFVAEDPEKLNQLVTRRKSELDVIKSSIKQFIPELQALFSREGERPIARYFNKNELKEILSDVLSTCESSDDKMYYIYSSAKITDFLYKDFSDFSDLRIAKGIKVKSIRIGEGGEIRGLDQIKWLTNAKQESPTYILIYQDKTAYISLNNAGEPVGVVIDNPGIYQVQKMIFEKLWRKI